jgi:carbonic anhydrase
MNLKNNAMRIAIAGAAALAIVAGANAAANAGAAWTYTGATGPNHWASIDPTNYATCADGTAQSPINISKPTKKALTNLSFSYTESEAGVFNNGHTVEVEPLGSPAPVETLKLSGETYSLLQIHFHAPSEHEMNGMHYPVELHFVHKAADNHLAVVGVFVKAGKSNAAWAPFVNKITSATAVAEETPITLDWAKLMPKNAQTARYNGSLTTPGCAEGVKWNVFTTPITMSQAQIGQFLEAYSGNNRPVQPLNNRKIYLDSTLNK